MIPDSSVKPVNTPGSGRVRIAGLSVIFGEGNAQTTALAATDLTLEPGTFTALIGPSGCGKSTLLNAVAGFTSPTEGAVQVDGRQVLAPHPSVGVIFQSFALFPWFTARGNVDFALKRFGLSKKERRSQAEAALKEVGLAEHAQKYPGQLSGGMKQRVAIARTLSADPDVLLMDEPFGALDAQTRLRMHEILTGIWMKHRKTVLFVTHDVDEALRLADVVYVMASSPGRIIKKVPVNLERPRPVDHMGDGFLKLRSELLGLLRHEE
ncbi:ABC transporter ATP-binding protein [Roseobacter sp.]|uniref:ABC transporter ATP-binding protein n=1 Tax=Roseobacter sp. TaxID=1907202 RepID=UPI0038586FD2